MSEESMSKEEIRTMIQVALGVRPMEISEISDYSGGLADCRGEELEIFAGTGKGEERGQGN